MKYPCFPKYKDSGVEWLGEVPEEWETKRLSAFFDERREKVNDTDYPPLSVGKFGVAPQIETAAKSDAGDNRKLLGINDFVVNSRSDRKGSAGVSSLEGSVSLIYIVITPRPCTNQNFIHYLLRSVPFQEEFYRCGKGIVADLWSTNYSEMKNIILAMPCMEEQQTIASFLDHNCAKIDALIAEQEKLIALLREKRQAVISHAVTKGLNPDSPMKDSGVEWLGEMPAGWEVSRLKFVATIQTGIAKGKDYIGKHLISVPYLRVANVQGGFLVLDNVDELEIPQEEIHRYALIPGDVLMNEGGDFDKLGRGAIWRGEISVCIHQNHVFAVRPHTVSPEWLNLLTGSDYAQNYFISRSKQSTNLASISSSNLMELPVVLPPTETQQTILTHLGTETAKIDTLITESEKAVTLLKERRSALISAAVTGKIDVRNMPLEN